MLSSCPGVRASGASSSLNSQNSSVQHETTHSLQQLGAGTLGTHPDLLRSNDMTNRQGTDPSCPGFSSPLDSSNWLDYTSQNLLQHTGAGPSASPNMIGPTSTLYDPDTSLQQPDAGQAYQQWIDYYNDQQQHRRSITHYADFLQNYPLVAYPESNTDTVIPPAANQYRQKQIQQNILCDSYRSELLVATEPINSVNIALSSTLDAQTYQQSTADSTINLYTSPPVSQIFLVDHHQSPQQAQNAISQKDQSVSQRANQQHFPTRFEEQPQLTVVPQNQEATHVSPHEHQPAFPSLSSQSYHEGQNGSPSANQHPSPTQQFSQESGNNVRESNIRKQPQESNSPYTTNQLNIQISPSRPGQAYGNGRASRANVNETGRGIGLSGSQATQSPSKATVGVTKGSPKHASPIHSSITVNSSPKRRKRDYEGNFINGGGDTEGESDGEEGDGFTGGIEIGLGGLGVESIDGKVEKGQRPYVISTHAEALI